MSFGFSTGDVVLLVQLAWTTVQNSRSACGEHADLTCEITSLHVNLQRLERESAKVESPINRPSDTCRADLAPIVNGCAKTLDVLDRILEKYNALSDGERSKGKLWKAVRFGNGELANVKDLRLKLIYYTANLSLFLNMISMGSMGVIEKQMYEAGGDLKEIRRAVNNITAHLISGAKKEGSVLTDYADDDKAVWRAFRRDLVKEGFSSDVIWEHKDTIQAYVKELGSRGILDDVDLDDSENVSQEIEDTELAQATPKARDEAMGSFESISGAARDGVSPRTATTAYFDNPSGTGNRDPRKNETISRKTQIAPASLNKVSDALPSTTQADADINSLAESDSRVVEKVDDRTNRYPSSAPIRLGQALPEIAEEDTWFLPLGDSGPSFRYYTWYNELGRYTRCYSAYSAKDFGRLSSPRLVRVKTLEFQAEADGFLKVAEVRTGLGSAQSWLKLSPWSQDHAQPFSIDSHVMDAAHQSTVINDLMQWGLRRIDARPEKWRISEWPIPRDKRLRRGNADGDKGKRSTVSPAASAAENGTQDLPSTTERVETEEIDEIQRTGNDPRTKEQKKSREDLVKEVNSIREKRRRRQELEENEARSIKEEKKGSLIKEEKNSDWMGPSRDRASSLDTTNPSWAGIVEELKSMGITEDQIQENADFIRDYIQQSKARRHVRTRDKAN